MTNQVTAPKTPKTPKAGTAKAGKLVKQPLKKPVYPELEYKNLLDFGLPEQLAVPLYKSVTTQRGGTSVTEANFVAWLLAHCSSMATLRMVDGAGNVHFTIPTPQGAEATSIFVAHTDTVHYDGGVNKVAIHEGFLHGVDEPLGADDGAGIAILCYMMHHKVPGRYIFTRQEETGGVGSTHIADTFPGLLARYKRAVAFDRRGDSEVVTHQGGTRCASDAFGEALSDALNEQGLLYMPSDAGVYTDTKEFRKEVAECVNVAVGYRQEHGSYENLDLAHVTRLAMAAVRIDWESLPTERDPEVLSFKTSSASLFDIGNYGSKWSINTPFEDAIHDFYWSSAAALKKLLVEELATHLSVDTATAERHIDMGKLRAHHIDNLDMTKDDLTLLHTLLHVVSEAV